MTSGRPPDMATPGALHCAVFLAATLLWITPRAMAGEEEDHLRRELGDAMQVTFDRVMETDAGIDAAARELAAAILDEQVFGEVGRGFTVARTHLWDHGVVDADLTYAAVVFDGSLATVSVLGAVADLQGLERYTHLGVGISRADEGGSVGCAAVVLTRRDVDLERWPEWIAGGKPEIVFTLREGLSDPIVDVVGPGPQLITPTPQLDDQERWHATIEIGRRSGVYRLEIRARRGDADVLAAIGVATIAGPASAPRDPEQHVRALVDLERRRHGLEQLASLEQLDGVASGHSATLQRGTPFGHRSDTLPAERIAAAGIPNSVALENVGRAASLDWVHTLFMASPGHRINVLDPRVTHLGIGVARSEPLAWYVTLNFVRLLPPLDLDQVRQQARDAITMARSRGGLSRLMTKRVLDDVAQRWCERVSASGEDSLTSDQVRDLTDDVLFYVDDAERIVADLAVVEEVGEISWLPELSHHAFDQYGLGIYQDASGGMLHVLLILVDRKSY